MLSLTVLPSASCSLPIFNKMRIIVAPIPDGSGGKESACSAGDLGLIPGSGRSPGEGNGYPLQHSCLKNYVDRGALQAWRATVHGGHKKLTQLKFLLLLFAKLRIIEKEQTLEPGRSGF